MERDFEKDIIELDAAIKSNAERIILLRCRYCNG